MNYLKKDLFGKYSFQNQGQVFTLLTQNYNDQSINPGMGQNPRNIGYTKIEDINYYKVPTPTTEILYRKGSEQGQVFDTKIAMNMTENFNFSIAYTGLRSLGAYRNSLSSFKNFTGTISYQTKNDRYRLRFHNTNQRILNQENGGLNDIAKVFFETNNPEYNDRGRLDINLENATSVITGKRYYLDHNYKLFSTKDSIAQKISNIKLGHVFTYETKQFTFDTKTSTDYFGDYFRELADDKTSFKSIDNKIYMDFTSPYLLGKFRVLTGYYYYFQGYDDLVYTNSEIIPSKITNNAISVGADWQASFKSFHLNAKASTNIAGSINGSNLFIQTAFKNTKNFNLSSSILLNSKSPEANYILFQSNYLNYNWFNDLKNIDTRTLNFDFATSWLQATASLVQIENYTYFSEAEQTRPSQYDETINYFKIKAGNEIKLGLFALDTDLIYQKVSNGSDVYKLPDFIARSTFYFSKVFFEKRSLFLQTGVTVNYFTAYNADNYNPLLGEFTLQKDDLVGGKPILDVFINAQIRRTRLYFSFENLLQLTQDNYYYSAPNQPYKDFTIKFGFIWNFFK